MNSPVSHFRPARVSDTDACASLIFTSGIHEFRFYLGQSDQRCIAFLRFAFASDHSHYSWRRYYVACAPDETVLSVIAAHHYRDARFDDLYESWKTLRFFGLRQTPAILRRGLILQREVPAPQHGQTLLTSAATDNRVRSIGIMTSMIADALTSGWLGYQPNSPSNSQYLLDVLLTNTRAHRLYEQRLGLVALPRQRPPSPRLPAELITMRMIWPAENITTFLRTQVA